MQSYKKFFLIVVSIAVALAAVFYYLGNLIPANPNTDKNQGVGSASPAKLQYLNPDFGISLEYPSSWKPVVGKKEFNKRPLYLGGDDGFFGIDAIGADLTGKVSIDDVVKALISDKSNPYGTSPSVTKPNTGKIETRLIAPSDNQSLEKKSEATLVVRYPEPLKIGNNTVMFFMLYADKAHLGDIAASLKLINM